MYDNPFEQRLFAWLDGQLPPAEAMEMEAWCAAHPEARARAEAERAADARIREALLSDPTAREAVARALAGVRAADAGREAAPAPEPSFRPAPARGRVLPWPRWFGATAAAAALVVAGLWFACVPPFECGVVEALENAAEVAQSTECGDGNGCPLTERMRAAATRLGLESLNPARVPVPCCPDCTGTAYRFQWKGEDVTCVWSPCRSCDPSFRRQCAVGAGPGWAGRSHGKSFAAFRDPATGNLCSVVGPGSEDTLTALAADLRAALH